MVIKTSASGEVARLVARLAGQDEVAREAAAARLTILGPRAVDSLIAALGSQVSRETRLCALRVLEAIGDRRALAPALALLGAGTDRDLTLGAIGVLSSQLGSTRREADRAFDGLAAAALDRTREETVRLAAIDALGGLPEATKRALQKGLDGDPSARIRARAASGPSPAPDVSRLALDEAAEGRLPASTDHLVALISAQAAKAPLPVLHRLVGAIRAREASERGASCAAWQLARAAAHQALAARQSTVALYDLRETLAAAREPLPVGFLAALSQIGDASCLEPIALAFVNARRPRNDWWRQHLATIFRDIVRRGHLTRRHVVVKRVLARWPEAADLMPQARGKN